MPVQKLSIWEQRFLDELEKNNGNKSKSFRTVFPEKVVGKTPKQVNKLAKELYSSPQIQSHLRDKSLPIREAIVEGYKRDFFFGNDKERQEASKQLLKIEAEAASDEGIKLWVKRMNEAGLEITIPPSKTATTYKFSDLLLHGGKLKIPLAGALQLLHEAGAPWNDQVPDAELSPFQIEYLERDERLLLAQGSRRLGKTVLTACFALLELLTPGRKIALVASEYRLVMKEADLVKRGFLKLFPMLKDWVRFNNYKNYVEFQIDTPWGSTIKGIPLDYKKGMGAIGDEYDLIGCCEAGTIDYEVFMGKVIPTTLSRKDPRITIFTTSYDGGFGVSAGELARLKKVSGGDLTRLHLPKVSYHESAYATEERSSEENPGLNREAVRAAAKMMEDAGFHDLAREQLGGASIRGKGLILPEFRRETHVLDELPPLEVLRTMRFAVGMDAGSKFAALLCGIDRDWNVYILKEYYSEKAILADKINDIKQMVVDVIGPTLGFATSNDLDTVYPLCRDRIDIFAVDKAAQDKADLIDQLGFVSYFKMDFEESVSQLRDLLRLRKLFVTDECVHWIEGAARRYHWTTKQNQLVPSSDGSHTVDATRYVIVGYLLKEGPLEAEVRGMSFDEAAEQELRRSLDWKESLERSRTDIWSY